MLRDVLTALPGFATWPCDEINLWWRHGNRHHPSDELGPELATEPVRTHLRDGFDRIRRRYDASSVVEKTCANSLRVPFVRRVLPQARYVLITRDGLDAAPSAQARWHAPLDLRYTAAKARFVPLGDVPYYGARFLTGRVRRRRRDSARPTDWWGPRVHDAAELRATRPLDEVCLIQWQRCVEASLRDLADLAPARRHHVVYEEFVADPERGLRQLLAFLGREDAFDAAAVAHVTAGSVGKGRAALSDDARERLTRLAAPTLEALGYGR